MSLNNIARIRTGHHEVVADGALSLDQLVNMDILTLCGTAAVGAINFVNGSHLDGL